MKNLNTLLKTSLFVAMTACSGVVVADPQPVSTSVSTQADTVRYEAFDVTVVGEGRPVLLIPGLSSSSSVWDSTVAALKDDYELHVFNLAGFAGVPAASPEKVGSSFLAFQKRAIAQYIKNQQLEGSVVIGHSLGGFLSLWLATDENTPVVAAINVDGLPSLGALFGQRPSGDSAPAAEQAFDPKMIAKSMANNTEWHDKIVGDMMGSDPMTAGRAMGELMQFDIRKDLANVAIPTLTIGAPAQGQPYVSYEQTQANYESQFTALSPEWNHMAFAKTSKHFIMADEPEWLNEQITSFLSELK